MADFCKQCSIDLFGEDFRELAGLVAREQYASGLGAEVICEGCGMIVVDPDGKCVGGDCIRGHKKELK